MSSMKYAVINLVLYGDQITSCMIRNTFEEAVQLGLEMVEEQVDDMDAICNPFTKDTWRERATKDLNSSDMRYRCGDDFVVEIMPITV